MVQTEVVLLSSLELQARSRLNGHDTAGRSECVDECQGSSVARRTAEMFRRRCVHASQSLIVANDGANDTRLSHDVATHRDNFRHRCCYTSSRFRGGKLFVPHVVARYSHFRWCDRRGHSTFEGGGINSGCRHFLVQGVCRGYHAESYHYCQGHSHGKHRSKSFHTIPPSCSAHNSMLVA
jgi:hypothetical protein